MNDVELICRELMQELPDVAMALVSCPDDQLEWFAWNDYGVSLRSREWARTQTCFRLTDMQATAFHRIASRHIYYLDEGSAFETFIVAARQCMRRIHPVYK